MELMDAAEKGEVTNQDLGGFFPGGGGGKTAEQR